VGEAADHVDTAVVDVAVVDTAVVDAAPEDAEIAVAGAGHDDSAGATQDEEGDPASTAGQAVHSVRGIAAGQGDIVGAAAPDRPAADDPTAAEPPGDAVIPAEPAAEGPVAEEPGRSAHSHRWRLGRRRRPVRPDQSMARHGHFG
jgi:hypothetical protein